MTPKVLVVEDIRLLLKGIVLAIRKIGDDDDKKQRHGIDGFKIDAVESAQEAYERLDNAISSSTPYDILMLDLKIPKQRKTSEPSEFNPEVGMAVLEYAKKSGAAKEIVVYSGFAEYEHVRKAFQLGALDFIPKGEDPERVSDKELLQGALLAAWERVLSKESARTLEERFKTLVPFAEKGLAHWFGGCFSRLIQSVAHEVEEMKDNLADRLGLDAESDTHDPLVWRLVTIQRSVSEAKDEWASMQANLAGSSAAPRELVVEEVLDKIMNDISPCMTLKRASVVIPSNGRTLVLSFSKESSLSMAPSFTEDVPLILREIIIGGLSEIQDRNGLGPEELRPVKISVTVSRKEEKAEVRFEDNMAPLGDAVADKINKGFNVAPDGDFGRVWGLSVAQHAALMGGGRLVIQPLQDGNVINYLIPLAN